MILGGEGQSGGVNGRQSLRVVLAFIALALLFGPVTSYASTAFDSGMRWQTLAGSALAALLGGGVLLLLSAVRRERMLSARQWLAVLVLLAPRWLAIPLGPASIGPLAWLHETRWGVGFLLYLAAPLWLGLLSALGMVPIEVPRAVVAASIAGLGAVLLVVPTNAYALETNQAPMLLVHLLLAIAVVFSWWYARQGLAGTGTLAAAGSFLLLSAAGGAVFSIVLERGAWQPVDWHQTTAALPVQAAVVAGSCWLWFYLLGRMPPAAFTMHPFAVWTASIAVEFVLYGFMVWRIDAALALAAAAIRVALRARVDDEDPVALRLHSR